MSLLSQVQSHVRASLGVALQQLQSRRAALQHLGQDVPRQFRSNPVAALQQAGIDLSTLVGAARLVALGRIRFIPPRALLRYLGELLVRGPAGATGLVRMHALASPDHTAIVFGERRLTYRALDERTNRLAHGFHGLGVGPRDRVATLFHNAPEHIEAAIALAHLGAVSVPIGYRLKAREIAHLVRDSGSKVLVFHASFTPTIVETLAEMDSDSALGIRPRCIVVAGEVSKTTAVLPDAIDYETLLAGQPYDVPPKLDGGGYGGVMVYTSGTTGKSKGATRNMREMGLGPTLNFLADLPILPDEKHLLACPLYHSTGTFFATVSLALGATLIVEERIDPETVLRTIERERVTSMVLVPTMWNRLLALGLPAMRKHDLSSLRWVMSVAAPLPTELARGIEEALGPILYNFYGATETGVVTLARPGEHTARPGTIGRLVTGTSIRILDEQGRDVPTGEVGELYVKNRMLVDGYHGNASATAAAQRDGWFSVGDLGRVDEDGYYYLADRKHDMVISGGVNIYPLEIEQRLHAHPAVSDAAVVGYPDPEWGESLAAFVVLRDGARASIDELQRFVVAELADYKRPRRVVFLPSLPRNPTGKVLKRELKQDLKQEL